jgi:hypothetical protein
MIRQGINDEDYIQYLTVLHTVEGAYATVASLFQAVRSKHLIDIDAITILID